MSACDTAFPTAIRSRRHQFRHHPPPGHLARGWILDARTLQSTPESGARAGYDGAKKRKGSKVNMAVDSLGYLLALAVTNAKESYRERVKKLAAEAQAATGESVEIVYVDQGYTGESAKEAAASEGVELVVVKLPYAKCSFVQLPKRWVVERSFGWMGRFRRLARDYERLSTTLAGCHWLAFAICQPRENTSFRPRPGRLVQPCGIRIVIPALTRRSARRARSLARPASSTRRDGVDGRRC